MGELREGMELGNGVVLIVWVNLGRGGAWKWGGAYSVSELREGWSLERGGAYSVGELREGWSL